jgi:hypothetical protein
MAGNVESDYPDMRAWHAPSIGNYQGRRAHIEGTLLEDCDGFLGSVGQHFPALARGQRLPILLPVRSLYGAWTPTTSLTIRLTPAQRRMLLTWQRATTIPAGLARRGRIILLVADGMPISEVESHAVST